MKLTITVDLDNAAFGECDEEFNAAELRRVLDKGAAKLVKDGFPLSVKLMDSNGNQCGEMELDY